MTTGLRFGIVGTGGWARHSHIPAATASESVEFVRAIGRHDDFDELLADVDAVGFAVPPHVQSPLALRAVEAGKHVLLEKPIALDVASAEILAAAASDAHVATIVFLTRRFIPQVAAWFDESLSAGGWTWGRVEMLSGALADMPSPGWRAEQGALWDSGPHALSLILPLMGAVRAVSAVRDSAGLVAATLVHDQGTSSLVTALATPKAAAGESILFAGESGRTEQPALGERAGRAEAAYTLAIEALVAQVGNPGHPCDVQFGAEIVRVLDAAERSIGSGGYIELG